MSSARARRPIGGSPAERARSALRHVDENEIVWTPTTPWDEETGASEGEEQVRLGLDALASALNEWRDLGLAGAAPLDEVLAVMGVPDDLVDEAGQLIDLIARSPYEEGLGRAEVEEAEDLRQSLAEGLDALLSELEAADDEDPDD
jgi:hypothetical protein